MGERLRQELPLKARYFIAAVIGSGIGILLTATLLALSGDDFSWLILAFLAALGGIFPVRLPFRRQNSQSLSITVSDVFVFTTILLYSPETATIVAALEATVTCIRARPQSYYRVLFNVSQLVVAVEVVGNLFYFLQGAFPPLVVDQIENVPLLWFNLALCAILYFGFNSGAVAFAVSLSTRKKFFGLWKENFVWASLTTVAGSSAAVLIFLNYRSAPALAFIISLPVILLIYFAYRTNLKQVELSKKHLEELEELYHSTITSLAMAIDAKDHSTHGHVQRVQALALGLAKRCGRQEEAFLKGLRAAALLHDIGKLAIPEFILNKPTQLSETELAQLQTHPGIGADILETVPFPFPVASCVRYHHERWDGTGYPERLRGEAIPLGARILAIVDCYDALLSERPYRPRLTRELALEYIKQESGKAFDPNLVETFVGNIEELEEEVLQAEQALPDGLFARLETVAGEALEDGNRGGRTVFHQIASTHKEVQAVYEISQTLGRSLNVRETLQLLAEKIRSFVPYHACAIYLISARNNLLHPHYVAGAFKNVLDAVEIRVGEGVSGWVAANRQPLLNVSPGPDFQDIPVLRSAFKNALAVPLSHERNVVGVITLYSDRPNSYLQEHLRLMETIVPHASNAINNAIIYEETQEDAYTDALTGLPNLRYFKVFIEEELRRAERAQYPLTILMMDLERFKEINDTLGHKVGDLALVKISQVLRRLMRKSDTCIRYGGDEFIGVFPGVNKELAQQTMARIQTTVDGYQVPVEAPEPVCVGISVGAATFPEDARSSDLLLAVADQAMYADKIARLGSRHSLGLVEK